MKYFQFVYRDNIQFARELEELKSQTGAGCRFLFQILTSEITTVNFIMVSSVLNDVFPDAECFGCTTNANIASCEETDDVLVSCTVFECSDSNVHVMRYDYSIGIENMTSDICSTAESMPDLKLIEMYFSSSGMSYDAFCCELDKINPDVRICGAIASCPDLGSSACLVYDGKTFPSHNSLIVVFYEGKELHAETRKITGWVPIGREFTITRAEGKILYELDGIPAYDVYNKYLDIENDDKFFLNALEFPLYYVHHDENMLKIPIKGNEDKSLVMSAEVSEGKKVRISYGDPQTILRHSEKSADAFSEFTPDVIHIFSCGARRSFWGADNSTYELEAFKGSAPSYGFFSHGEFIRTHGYLNKHNVTLVFSALREGPVKENAEYVRMPARSRDKKKPLITRLSNFITETSNQINELNEQIKQESDHYLNILTHGCSYNVTADLTDGMVYGKAYDSQGNNLFEKYNTQWPMSFDDCIKKYFSFHSIAYVDHVLREIGEPMTLEQLLEKCRDTLTCAGLLEQFANGVRRKESVFYEVNWKRFLRISIYMSENKTDRHISALILVDDVTAQWEQDMEHERILKEAIEAANQASEAKTSFLANMSHEIRTPMNAVLGMAEMALAEEMSDDARDYVHQIRNSGKNLLVIINDILDFSKIESGKLDIVKVKYDPLSMLNDLSNVINAKIGNGDIEFVMDIDPLLPVRMYGDNIRITQILINLLNNAVKFTKKGSVKLSIRCEFCSDNDSEVILHGAVTDTGIGIKEEDIGKLFKSFQQVDSKRNRSIEGTGLGLSICQRLLELMGGSISVSSVYNVGSTFSFTLPQKIEKPSVELRTINGGTGLVYTDNNYSYEQLVKDLSNVPVSLVTAENEEQVLNSDFSYLFISLGFLSEDIVNKVKSHPDITCIVSVPYNSTEKSEYSNIIYLRRPITVFSLFSALGITDCYKRTSVTNENVRAFTAPDASILVVDDTAINLTVAKGLLKSLNMTIDTAQSAAEAIKKIQEKQYDLIFMDHMMPETDGVEATHIIRKNYPSYADVPIIALTANAVGDVKEMFVREGMNDFVAKPIDVKIITATLMKWLPQDKIILSDGTDADNDAEVQTVYIEGLNTEAAVSLIGSTELYWTMLENYYKSIDEKYDVIRKYYESGMIKDYTINVHSLKSTSRQIGADELADLAALLEKAGNEGDTDLIDQRTEEMLSMFLKVKDILSGYFVNKQTASDELTPDALDKISEKLTEALDSFDALAVDEVFEEFDSFLSDDILKNDISELRDAADSFDSDLCSEIIERIKNRITV